MVKPKILLSRCFNEAVRYDGERIQNFIVEKLKPFIEPVYICPEVEIGLGVPRPRIIIVKEGKKKRLLQVDTGLDLTEKMYNFVKNLCPLLKELEGACLKSKSPSCGVGSTKLYYKGSIIGKTYGFLAESLKKIFPELPLEDEKRLEKSENYYQFLCRIFALADWKVFLKEANEEKLLLFHQNYEFLLKTFDEELFKNLEFLLKRKNLSFEQKLSFYGSLFKKILSKKPTKAKHLNTLYQILNYFSKKITPKEKQELLTFLEKYRKGKIELKVILKFIKNLAFSLEESFILSQKYLQPFPEELLL